MICRIAEFIEPLVLHKTRKMLSYHYITASCILKMLHWSKCMILLSPKQFASTSVNIVGSWDKWCIAVWRLTLLYFFLHSGVLLFVLWRMTLVILRHLKSLPLPFDCHCSHLTTFFSSASFFDLMELRTFKPWRFWGEGLPQKSFLIVLIRRLFSVFFFSSNLEKVTGVPSLLGLRVMTILKGQSKQKALELPQADCWAWVPCYMCCLFKCHQILHTDIIVLTSHKCYSSW